MSTDVVVGFDIGLTGMKVVAFDLTGEVVAVATEASPQDIPQPHWIERDGRDFWMLVGEMSRDLTDQLKAKDCKVLGIGLSAHGDGAFLVDENNDLVRPGILSLDSRARKTAEKLMETRGEDLMRVTGQPVVPASTGAVLRWLKDNEPEALEKAAYFMFAKDFLRGKMTDTVGTDLTEASTAFTGHQSQEYEDEAFEIYDLEELKPKAPKIYEPTDVVGHITHHAARHTGFDEGIPVVAGLHDVDAGAIGAGAVAAGQLAVMAGTWSINELITDVPAVDERWLARAFAKKGMWMNMSVSPASASNLEWFVATLCQAEVDAAKRAGTNPFAFVDQEISEIGKDDEPVTFLPFLYGNPLGVDAKASISGLRAWHKRGHILGGVYEGIAFTHRYHIDPFKERQMEITDVRVTGGVTRSKIWPQMFADTINMPVIMPTTPEGGALGTAMVAAVGAGAFPDLDAAADAMGSETSQVDPTPEGVERMEARYQVFLGLIESQKPWWKATE